ncbi:MAG: tetratricopeptide repeat protein [Candidatus Omnitrophica bacterium]|nr:tetratricopeptide repeat protein [Candidatus Omnitrophota bacterium]
MEEVDFEKERKAVDRLITFFQFKKAARQIEKCIKSARMRKNSFFLHYFLAQRYILREDFHRAKQYLNVALSIKGADGCTLNDKALCLAELGRYEEALKCLEEGIRKDRDCASLYHNKGWLLNCLGRYRESIIYFYKALELEEDRPEALYSLADTYANLGNLTAAKKYFLRALQYIKGKSSYMRKETLKRLKALEH